MWEQASGTPVARTAASSSQLTETSTTVGTVECAGVALDLSGTTTARQGSMNAIASRWKAVNVDTGAGGTVWPMNADYGFEKVAGPEGRSYKTATGEMVEGPGRFRVQCHSVWSHLLREDGSTQTVAERWRLDGRRSCVVAGWRCWLHHSARPTDFGSDAQVFQESL